MMGDGIGVAVAVAMFVQYTVFSNTQDISIEALQTQAHIVELVPLNMRGSRTYANING